MLFCDREYYECCSSLPTARPDSWETMLSLCRCAVERFTNLNNDAMSIVLTIHWHLLYPQVVHLGLNP